MKHEEDDIDIRFGWLHPAIGKIYFLSQGSLSLTKKITSILFTIVIEKHI